jgi:hypothetical protein
MDSKGNQDLFGESADLGSYLPFIIRSRISKNLEKEISKLV